MQSRNEKHLIILRGVPASGKTQVSKILQEKIGGNVKRINLDDYAFNHENIPFENMINDALKYDYVIGELYSGRWHTTNPLKWISKFKVAGYIIHSFVLHISFEKGYEKCCERAHITYRPYSKGDYCYKYQNFYERLQQNVFASQVGIEDVIIDAEDCNYDRMAFEILKAI